MSPLKNFRNIITNIPNSPCILKNRPKVIFQKVLSGGKELLPQVYGGSGGSSYSDVEFHGDFDGDGFKAQKPIIDPRIGPN